MTRRTLPKKALLHFTSVTAIIGAWVSGNLFHIRLAVATLAVGPRSAARPSIGSRDLASLTRQGHHRLHPAAQPPVNIAYSVLPLWYTIGCMTTNAELIRSFHLHDVLSAGAFRRLAPPSGPKFLPPCWFKNAESRLNHHLAVLFGQLHRRAVTCVHVPSPRPEASTSVGQLLNVLPPSRLLRSSRQLGVYAEHPDTPTVSELPRFWYERSSPPGASSPNRGALAHHIAHHLASAALFCDRCPHVFATNSGSAHSIRDLEAHNLLRHHRPVARLVPGHKGLMTRSTTPALPARTSLARSG